MDINKITDIKEVKALAFDTLGRIEMEQHNLRILQKRIAELNEPEDKTEE